MFIHDTKRLGQCADDAVDENNSSDSFNVVLSATLFHPTHNIFYTAITRSKKHLKIYWSPETQEKVISGFKLADAKRDASIFKAQTGMRMYKVR